MKKKDELDVLIDSLLALGLIQTTIKNGEVAYLTTDAGREALEKYGTKK